MMYWELRCYVDLIESSSYSVLMSGDVILYANTPRWTALKMCVVRARK